MKEFIEATGIPYEDIDLNASPERGERLMQFGLRAPAVILGDRYADGANLMRVAEILGVDWEAPVILEPAELKAKYDIVASALLRLISQIPDGGLEYRHPLRDRTLRGLIAHAGTIMRGQFLQPYSGDSFDRIADGPLDLRTTGTIVDLETWVSGTRDEFNQWWENEGFDDNFEGILETHWGHRTLLEVFERAVWHTAQHARQVALLLQDIGIEPAGALTSEDLAGLPVPKRIFT
jgi:hypothetical protein